MIDERFEIAPYFDDLLALLDAGDEASRLAYGRHVHWGWWPDPALATNTPADYGAAAERLCQLVCDAAGIQDGMRVLDVGCGLGGTIASLNDRFRDLDLLGVNIDPRQVKRARETVQPRAGNRIRFETGDACDLQIPAGSFDAVLAVECIFHFESREAFFAGAAKALKPGGRLAICDFVPPADKLPILEQHNPGTDKATLISYGKVDLLCTVERYRSLAEAARLEPPACRDITAGTMPTYDFMRVFMSGWPDRAAARAHSRATGRLEFASQAGWLNYTILSFAQIA